MFESRIKVHLMFWGSLLIVLSFGCAPHSPGNNEGGYVGTSFKMLRLYEQRDFFYNTQEERCLNNRGEEGYNLGFIGECADLSDLNLANQDLSWLNLRGASFLGTQLKHTDLTGADLTGALFMSTDVSEATLDLTVQTNQELEEEIGQSEEITNLDYSSTTAIELQQKITNMEVNIFSLRLSIEVIRSNLQEIRNQVTTLINSPNYDAQVLARKRLEAKREQSSLRTAMSHMQSLRKQMNEIKMQLQEQFGL